MDKKRNKYKTCYNTHQIISSFWNVSIDGLNNIRENIFLEVSSTLPSCRSQLCSFPLLSHHLHDYLGVCSWCSGIMPRVSHILRIDFMTNVTNSKCSQCNFSKDRRIDKLFKLKLLKNIPEGCLNCYHSIIRNTVLINEKYPLNVNFWFSSTIMQCISAMMFLYHCHDLYLFWRLSFVTYVLYQVSHWKSWSCLANFILRKNVTQYQIT